MPACRFLAALVRRSFAQHATTMFFPLFVDDACSREVLSIARHFRAARTSFSSHRVGQSAPNERRK